MTPNATVTRKHLEAMGITGAALRALLREGAVRPAAMPAPSEWSWSQSHVERVAAAHAAAEAGAADLLGLRHPGGRACQLELGLAVALVGLDGYSEGVDGTAGFRLPCFRSLGCGRTDGADASAWNAALVEAFAELLWEFGGPVATVAYRPNSDGGLEAAFSHHGHEWRSVLPHRPGTGTVVHGGRPGGPPPRRLWPGGRPVRAAARPAPGDGRAVVCRGESPLLVRRSPTSRRGRRALTE